MQVLHDCLHFQVFVEILNFLCKLFGTEPLILRCLWTVLIPVATVIWVPIQPDMNPFTDKVKLTNEISVMSFPGLNVAVYVNCIRSKNIVLELSIPDSGIVEYFIFCDIILVFGS